MDASTWQACTRAHLPLLEERARAEHRAVQVVARGLHRRARRLRDALQVLLGDAAGAEEAAVGKVLGGQVADRQAGEHNVGARVDNLGEL